MSRHGKRAKTIIPPPPGQLGTLTAKSRALEKRVRVSEQVRDVETPRHRSRFARVAALAALFAVVCTFVLVAVWQVQAPTQSRCADGECGRKPGGNAESRKRTAENSKPRVHKGPLLSREVYGDAIDIIGSYSLGNGWLIQVMANPGGELQIQCWRESDWFRPVHLPRPLRVAGKQPEAYPLGMTRSNRYGSPLMNELAMEWTAVGETIQVHLGTPGSDRFVRPSHVCRCLFLGLGGADTVAYDMDRVDELRAVDRMTGAGGKECGINVFWPDPVESGPLAVTRGAG